VAADTASGITVLTGALGAAVLTPLIAGLGRDNIEILAIENQFFGGNTGVTGLMTGADLSRHLADAPPDRRYLLPDVCLSDDGVFLDGMSVDDLPVPVDIIPTDGHSLRRALEGAR
jgi:NifB/MoaA-like Fe-S oxidoreductase